ncbi:transporter [Pseudomonas sp. Marseille-Q5117]|uniref:transporter n=1 Tax=Pseudomonas sp. Marseille-Q5117 TaxID=2972777 RepID=UPI0021C91985|nr:transporter [Pseudomonas sp. Marseille-Q5117]
MRKITIKKTAILSILATSIIASKSHAIDLNSRDFIPAPLDTDFAVVYLPTAFSNDFHGPADNLGTAEVRASALVYRQVWTTDICGLKCTPQFIIKYVDIDSKAPGMSRSDQDRGIGDPTVGATLMLLDEPASGTYIGLMGLLTIPIGEYDSRSPSTSPGGNRWASDINLNITKRLGHNWVAEINFDVEGYGKNDDFAGSELKQRPLFRSQNFISYDFSPSTYAALKLEITQGGELEINGRTIADSKQRYTQLGVEAAHWLDKSNQIAIFAGKNISSSNSYDMKSMGLRYVHVF